MYFKNKSTLISRIDLSEASYNLETRSIDQTAYISLVKNKEIIEIKRKEFWADYEISLNQAHNTVSIKEETLHSIFNRIERGDLRKRSRENRKPSSRHWLINEVWAFYEGDPFDIYKITLSPKTQKNFQKIEEQSASIHFISGVSPMVIKWERNLPTKIESIYLTQDNDPISISTEVLQAVFQRIKKSQKESTPIFRTISELEFQLSNS